MEAEGQEVKEKEVPELLLRFLHSCRTATCFSEMSSLLGSFRSPQVNKS